MIGKNDTIEVSILIVSKNRKKELEKTLQILHAYLETSKHEICVFLDGCNDNSQALILEYPHVKWLESQESLGASKARNSLYKIAKGTILVGLDDDAHPLQSNFITLIEQEFNKHPNAGILAFQEIKGVFSSDEAAYLQAQHKESYHCNSFIGCGFAIKKEVYLATNGFPIWIDIYGEEDCVAIEVLAQGYDIRYVNSILVNHRVDLISRKRNGYDQFRFKKQLKNTVFYYLVYYPKPMIPILKLVWHNFKKYGFKNWRYFRAFCQSVISIFYSMPRVIKYRNPIDKKTIRKKINLPSPQF